MRIQLLRPRHVVVHPYLVETGSGSSVPLPCTRYDISHLATLPSHHLLQVSPLQLGSSALSAYNNNP